MGYYIPGIVGAVGDFGPSSWVKGSIRTETASAGLALTEQSTPHVPMPSACAWW